MSRVSLSNVCVRALLCNLVRAKLGCYEAEGQNSPSPEDYLKAFMETEVKPLWPKGWMQARCVCERDFSLIALPSLSVQVSVYLCMFTLLLCLRE